MGFGCNLSNWSESVLEVDEVGVDHVREREGVIQRRDIMDEKKKGSGAAKTEINVIKLIKNK